MPDFSQLPRLIRVGLIAVAPTDELLSNVGVAAWNASGAADVEAALPADYFSVIRPLVVHGGGLDDLRRVMRDWCDAPNREVRCDLILTVGGDGLASRDVVADAAREVIERHMPALATYLRESAPDGVAPLESSPLRRLSILTRATAGTRGATLIVNIPSCFANPADAVAALLPLLPDALAQLVAM